MGWKRPVRGFWYKTKPMGLGDGREGLQHALSVLRNSVEAHLPPGSVRRRTVPVVWRALRGREGIGMGRTRWAVAAVAVVASLFSFAFSALAFAPGKARWPIKTSVPEGADLDHPTRVDLADLIDAAKLPDAPSVTKNDAQFQAARIPKF